MQEPKYAKQIKQYTNGTVFFYAEADFHTKSEEDFEKDSVLDILSDSKIGLFLFNKDNKDSVKYNIEAETAYYIFEKTRQCMDREFLQGGQPKNDGSSLPAYAVYFKTGKLAGKTAAELLLENPANREVLINQYNFLRGQTNPKFAAMNKLQMEAIVNAIQLFDAGKLNKDALAARSVCIYNGTKTPSIKTVDARGLTKVCILNITYTPGENSPFRIHISNCMAPPVTGKQVGAYLSQAQDKHEYEITLSEEDWFIFWKSCVNRIKDFEEMVRGQYFSVYTKYKDAWKNKK